MKQYIGVLVVAVKSFMMVSGAETYWKIKKHGRLKILYPKRSFIILFQYRLFLFYYIKTDHLSE